MWISLILFGCLASVFGNQGSEFKEIDSIYDEVPCLSMGGRCVLSKDCSEEKRTDNHGLCPVQQKRGVECCYGVSNQETRCRKRGGECVPKSWRCDFKLHYEGATDCSEEKKCCILVR